MYFVCCRGSLFKYDTSVSFWNFLAAGNYASRFYRFAIRDINALQSRLFESSMSIVQRVEAEIRAGTTGKAAAKLLTAATDKAAEEISTSWRDLLPQLIGKYHDGYETTETTSPHVVMKKLFYPSWWLRMTGYFNNPINQGPDVIMFAENQAVAVEEMHRKMAVAVFATAVLSVAATVAAMWFLNQRKSMLPTGRGMYSVIGDENL